MPKVDPRENLGCGYCPEPCTFCEDLTRLLRQAPDLADRSTNEKPEPNVKAIRRAVRRSNPDR